MIIEFLALPGTGKSFLSRKLKMQLQKDGIDSILTNERIFSIHSRFLWRFRKLISIISLVIIQPSVVKLIFIILNEKIPIRYKVSSIYNLLAVISLNKRRHNPKTITIRDEGIFQLIFALCLFGTHSVEKYYEILNQFISLPDHVIVLQSSEKPLKSLSDQGREGRIYNGLVNGTISEGDLINSFSLTHKFLSKLNITFSELYYSKTDQCVAEIVYLMTDQIKNAIQ